MLDGPGSGAVRADKVRTALAQAYLRAGRSDDAERALREVIARTPEYVDAHVSLGNLLVERREFAPATVAYERAASLRPEDPQLAFTVCQLYLFRRQDEQALDWLERALRNGLPNRQSLRGQGLFKRLEKCPRFLELTR